MPSRESGPRLRLGVVVLVIALGSGFGPRPIRATTQSVADLSGIYAGHIGVERLSRPYGYIAPGDSLRLQLCLVNRGTVDTGSVTGELLAVNRVASPSEPQVFGVLQAGWEICRYFDIVVDGSCGMTVVPTLRLTAGQAEPRDLWLPYLHIGQWREFSGESFSDVFGPELPPGWTTQSLSGTPNPWFIKDTVPPTHRSRAFIADPGTVSDSVLTGPSFRVPLIGAHVEFQHAFDLEGLVDGGVLEISIDGGAFRDIIAAGGIFQRGGYNGVVVRGPLAGRPTWTGSSKGDYLTTVLLPPQASGSTAVVRWRMATDAGGPGLGWSVAYRYLDMPVCGEAVPANIDVDRKSELALYRPDDGRWSFLESRSGYTHPVTFSWGADADVPVAGDFDGDGLADITIYRPSTGHWFILRSTSNFTVWDTVQWGIPGDIPAPGTFAGAGPSDITVFRPSHGTWHIIYLGNTVHRTVEYQLGGSGDVPAPADFDGDTRSDFAVFRPSTGEWLVLLSTTAFDSIVGYQWGTAGDIPVPGDYDGDRKADLAVYRPSNGTWYILSSASGFTVGYGYVWGLSTDVPVPGDYDGDGRVDITVWRPSSGHWFILKSGTQFTQWDTFEWGDARDVPVLGPRR